MNQNADTVLTTKNIIAVRDHKIMKNSVASFNIKP